MGADEFVSLKQLADALGLDRSNARKYVLKQGFKPVKRRTLDSGGMLALSFTKEEAERIIAVRREQGFFGGPEAKPISDEKGYFYVIQLIPEFEPNRVKLGFASDVEDRLQQHRTSAPTATVRQMWPCRKTWEVTAIAALTATGSRLILNEVFECDGVEQLLARGDAFFALLPDPGSLTPLAPCSPLSQSADNLAVPAEEEFVGEDEVEEVAAEPAAAPDRGRLTGFAQQDGVAGGPGR
jgi:hypothetical protein